tara:strand:+ start:118 stop:285 length:168 start_codon:yes stop_codon:yes gene_type:complete
MKRIVCIENPWNLPFIKVGSVYMVVANHETRDDHFEVLGEGNTRAYYQKVWFLDI